MNLTRLQLGGACVFAACIALSTIHPWGNPNVVARPGSLLLQGSGASDGIRALLAAKCGDCHSETTHYPLYAHFAPVSWMLERDIHEGRRSLDLSQWESMSLESRISLLTRVASAVHAGQMPPQPYVLLHPGSRLSTQEQLQIYDWAKAERKRLREQTSQISDPSSKHLGIENP